jgi:RING finger family protein
LIESDSVVKLKINKRYEAQPCSWCGNVLQLGEDGAICQACGAAHHSQCWDGSNGCGAPGCINAPLNQEAVQPEPENALPPDWIKCPHCNSPIWGGYVVCPQCGMVTSPDGIYHGPKTTSREAKKALTQAVISFFICAPILGPIAIKNANSAITNIDKDPTLQGRGMATIAKALGFISIFLWGFALLIRLSGVLR